MRSNKCWEKWSVNRIWKKKWISWLKIPNTSGPIEKIAFNTKSTEIEDKTSDTRGVVINTTFNKEVTEIDDKRLDTSGLVKKTPFS